MSLHDAPQIPRLAAESSVDVQKTTNKVAVAGLVLSIAPLFGLAFSITGLIRAKSAGGAGRRAGAAGIVLSLAFAGLYGFGAYELGGSGSSSNSLASDPGCVTAEASLNGTAGKIFAIDNQNLLSALGPMTNAQYVYARVVTDDIKTLRATLDGAVGQATHGSVKSAVSAVDTDLSLLSGDASDLSSSSYFSSDLTKYTADVYALYNLCEGGTGKS